MFLWLVAALASAGSIYIDASTPILARIQGEKLAKKEPSLRVVLQLARRTYGDVRLSVISDHGMADVGREEDVQAGKLVSKDASLKNLVKSKQLGMNRGVANAATSPEEPQ